MITFLQDYVDNWDTLSDEFFEQQKNGLIARLTEQDKNLSQRSQRYWQSLAEENYDFDSNQQIADIVTALTKADMGGFLQDLLRRVENRRVKIYSQGAFAQSAANPDA